MTVEVVEGVEKFVLCPFFAGDELDVVDEQHIHCSVAFPKLRRLLGANGHDQIVGERLGRDVAHSVAVLAAAVADGMQ